MQPHFKPSITFHPETAEFHPHSNVTRNTNTIAFDPSGGPLEIPYPSWTCATSSWISRSFEELGFRDTAGFVGGNLYGWGFNGQTLTSSQVRSSSESFLREALL